MSRSPRRSVRRLLLIYDAPSGILAAAQDSLRKLLGQGACALCTITHGLFGERPAWRRLRRSLTVPVDTLHNDQLGSPLDRVVQGALPAVVGRTEAGDVLLLGPQVLGQCAGSVQAFRRRMLEALENARLELPSTGASEG